MYPETDLPSCPIDMKTMEEVRSKLPERPEATVARLRALGLSSEVTQHLVRAGDVAAFDLLVLHGLAAGLVARVLTQELPSLEREAQRPLFDGPESLPDILLPILRNLEQGAFAKEGLLPVLRGVLVEGLDIAAAIQKAGLTGLTLEDLERIVTEVLDQNSTLVSQKKMGALGPLMGDVMAKVRGKRDGKEVSQTLERLLRQRVASSP